VLLEVLTTGFEAANSDIGISRYEIIHPDELDSSAIITISTSKQQTQIKKNMLILKGYGFMEYFCSL